MTKYMVFAVIMDFAVNFLLMLSAIKLWRVGQEPVRAFLGAGVGLAYTLLCLNRHTVFLQGNLYRGIFMILMCLCAFGVDRVSVRCALTFCLSRLALDGLSTGENRAVAMLWAAVLCLLGLYILWGRAGKYVEVELTWGNQAVRCTALHDTGNTLCDPITGSRVLVVGADVAYALMGLSKQQLLSPVQTVQERPGLRLIPYKTVGRSGDFLLAARIDRARVGKRRQSVLVAFAPEQLDEGGTFQALIGGIA